MYFNEEFETLPRPALEALQLKRLQATLERVYANVPFYKASYDTLGIKPSILNSLEDLQKLPFTTKQDMRDSYPYGLFAAPMEEIVRIHASSGTTGKPTVVGYTGKDISTARCRCPVAFWKFALKKPCRRRIRPSLPTVRVECAP